MLFDLPLEELRGYRPQLDEPADFDEFWATTLEQTRAFALDASFEPAATLLSTVEVFDVRFAGYDGAPIAAWLLLPTHRVAPLPCVVEFIGYGGGRGLPHEWLGWSAFGYANLVMDTRGQGSAWRSGVTRDVHPGGSPHVPGFLTLGLPSRDDYYYRRLYVDAVRAVEAAGSHPDVDGSRIAVAGSSQGGGLAIAAASLLGDQVQAAMPDVPFLSHFRRAVDLADKAPYTELLNWCRIHADRAEEAFAALACFDGAILGRRASAPALFSVGMHDPICPPSTVFAAYNNYGGADKDIRVWQWHEHEGGEGRQRAEQVAWLRTIL